MYSTAQKDNSLKYPSLLNAREETMQASASKCRVEVGGWGHFLYVISCTSRAPESSTRVLPGMASQGPQMTEPALLFGRVETAWGIDELEE